MDGVTFLPGITQKKISTGRLEVAYLEAGAGNPEPVVLIHGNVSCGWFFEELILELAKTNRYHLFAPDMRGYGATQTLPVDATRGVKDFAEDLFSFIQAVGLGQTRFFLLGWSLGGNVVMEYTLDHSETLRGLILESAGSPFGFGGTQGPGGAPNYSDFAGSGGGTANPEFVQRLEKGDRTGDAPVSPRNVMNAFYFKPPFKASAKIEETFVSAMLSTRVRPEGIKQGHWRTLFPVMPQEKTYQVFGDMFFFVLKLYPDHPDPTRFDLDRKHLKFEVEKPHTAQHLPLPVKGIGINAGFGFLHFQKALLEVLAGFLGVKPVYRIGIAHDGGKVFKVRVRSCYFFYQAGGGVSKFVFHYSEFLPDLRGERAGGAFKSNKLFWKLQIL